MIEAFGPLPRPACGERGPFPVSGSADIWEPASAPHPEAARNGAGSDLSPQGGEVTGRAVNSFTTPEMTALIFPAEPAYVLRNATGARALLAQPQSYPEDGETVRLDLAAQPQPQRTARVCADRSRRRSDRALVDSRRRRTHALWGPLRLCARHSCGAHVYRQH